jgi:hypothetical protein
MTSNDYTDLITDIDQTVRTLSEVTGHSPDVVWLRFIQWYVEDLHYAGLGPCELPADMGFRIRLAA